jgi:Flp pilus assembly protein TadG
MNLPARSFRRRRRGATTTELALILPFLCFPLAAVMDYGRVFYFGVTV